MKKNYTKKISAVLFTMILIIFVFTACQHVNNEAESSGNTEIITQNTINKNDNKETERTKQTETTKNVDSSKDTKVTENTDVTENNKENNVPAVTTPVNNNKNEDKNQDNKNEDNKNQNVNKSTNSTNSSVNQTNHSKNEVTEHKHNYVSKTETVHHNAEYKTVHHDAEYKTVHHDAEYENTWIVDIPAQPDTITNEPIYDTRDVYTVFDKRTGEVFKFYSQNDQMKKAQELGAANCITAESTESYIVGYQEVNWHDGHEEVGHWENVLVKDAYDEKVLVKDAYDEKVLVKAAWDETVTKQVCSICGNKK